MSRVPLPRETVVTMTRDGQPCTLAGRAYRGLLLTQPYDLREEPPAIMPQSREHPYWQVWHVASGMTVARIWGHLRAAWAEFCRLAEAADWTRPRSEVAADETCWAAARDLRKRNQML